MAIFSLILIVIHYEGGISATDLFEFTQMTAVLVLCWNDDGAFRIFQSIHGCGSTTYPVELNTTSTARE